MGPLLAFRPAWTRATPRGQPSSRWSFFAWYVSSFSK